MLKNMDWQNWLEGMWVAVVGGASNAVLAGMTLNFVDPKDFNVRSHEFYQVVVSLFVVSAIKDFFLYLSQNPLPRLISKTTTTLTVEKVAANAPPDPPDPPDPPSDPAAQKILAKILMPPAPEETKPDKSPPK